MEASTSTDAGPSGSRPRDIKKSPLLLILLKHLMNKSPSTTMTNPQVRKLLMHDYDIHENNCHEVELEVYINVIKKFAKDWLQREEVQRKEAKITKPKDVLMADSVNKKYMMLKEYLGVKLKISAPLAKQALADHAAKTRKVMTNNNNNEGALATEIPFTNEQMEHRPTNTDVPNAIVNTERVEPTIKTLTTLTLETILNFCWTKVYLQLPNFVYFRELIYQHKHSLVNKGRNEKQPLEVLDTQVCNIMSHKKIKQHPKIILYQYFDKILKLCKDEQDLQLLEVLINVLKTDLAGIPEKVKVPSGYRKYANPYKYVRYLPIESKRGDGKYDLLLEEIVSPTYRMCIVKLGTYPEALPPLSDWLKIECMTCKETFSGSTDLMEQLQAHFTNCQQNEPDWQCQNCNSCLSIHFLSKNRWNHNC